MESWHTTYDTKEAAVFAHLGATVKIWSTIFEKQGERRVRFDISTSAGSYNVGRIRAAAKDRSLLRTDPAHPYLIGMLACQNRHTLLDVIHRGTLVRLAPIESSPTLYQLLPSDTLRRFAADHRTCARTPDIHMAAALLTAGFPLLSITGAAPSHLFTFPSHPLPGAGPLDAPTLISDWRSRPAEMPPSVFTHAAGALACLATLHREVRNVIDTVIISKPGTTSHASIRVDAAPRAWDTAKRFLSGQ